MIRPFGGIIRRTKRSLANGRVKTDPLPLRIVITMPISEKEIAPDVLKEFELARARGAQLLKLTGVETPQAVLQTLEQWINKWQDQRTKHGPFVDPGPGKPGMVDYSLWLSTVWGDQMVRQFAWEWTFVVNDGNEWYGVASPDRSMVIYPSYFVKHCLDDPHSDCTIVLAYNMLLTQSIPAIHPKAYSDLMSGVRRIVPRR